MNDAHGNNGAVIEPPTDARVVDVRMPQLGESVAAGTIVRWLKAPGDPVAADEPLYEVTSDKATMEVPALAAGYLREIVAAAGDIVDVGAVVARIAGERDRLSPVVRKLLREHGLDAAAVARAKPGGRLTKDDVLAYVADRKRDPVPVYAAPASAADGRDGGHALPVSPSAARPPSPGMADAGSPPAAEVRRIPLSPLRRRAAERLTAAQKNAVNVFSAIELDVEAVAGERARRKLTYLPFIARAIVEALRAYPALNATFDEADPALMLHEAVHLGIAVDLDEAGLVVPVIRNAHRFTLDGLAGEIERLAVAARSFKLGPDDYAGSTFTITNNGAFGTLLTAPVINAPNVAIVSTDAVELRPVIVDRAIAIRHRMYASMTWDHRAFDGSTAARFLRRIKHNVETWDWTAQ